MPWRPSSCCGRFAIFCKFKSVTGLRLLNRYDVEGVADELFARCLPIVFFEPQLDTHDATLPTDADVTFAVEYLPGQYDQRAASCEECIQLVGQCDRPTVRTARVYLLTGTPTAEEIARIKKHVINPVESREADLAEKEPPCASGMPHRKPSRPCTASRR